MSARHIEIIHNLSKEEVVKRVGELLAELKKKRPQLTISGIFPKFVVMGFTISYINVEAVNKKITFTITSAMVLARDAIYDVLNEAAPKFFK
jgi:hypothetical protein